MKIKTFEAYLREVGEIEVPVDRLRTTFDVAVVAEALGYTKFADEHLGVLCANSENLITGYHEISKGSVASTQMNPSVIIKRALLSNAHTIAVFHNHPEGSAMPSDADIEGHRRLKESCKRMQIHLLDNIVVAGDGKTGHEPGSGFFKSIDVEMWRKDGTLEEKLKDSIPIETSEEPINEKK